MSGSTNVGEAFDLIASRRAAESTYAGIVRLVEAAQRSKAPMSRLADRFALVFLGVTVVIAGGAWLWTGDPIRAVAVLVVATPCPLILAVPVAIVSGLSRAAKHGILIKGGKALEILARIRSVVIDKTGTLTDGRARIVAIAARREYRRTSPRASLRRSIRLPSTSSRRHSYAEARIETSSGGADRHGRNAGRRNRGYRGGPVAIVGGMHFVRSRLSEDTSEASLKDARRPVPSSSRSRSTAGWPEKSFWPTSCALGTEALLRNLTRLGVERIVLATGDRREVAEAATAGLGFSAVRSELTPDQKVMVVLSERKNGPVMMVGDGVNDAPALAAADIGVAMGARGAAASAEAADVVLLVDQLDRDRAGDRDRGALAGHCAGERLCRHRPFACRDVRRSLGGYITPVQGALLQEVIDVAVILNALRALRDQGGRFTPWQIAGRAQAGVDALRPAHQDLA